MLNFTLSSYTVLMALTNILECVFPHMLEYVLDLWATAN